MSKLIITEKPSVARDIAKVIKANKRGEGYLRNDEYIVTWAVGHLVSLCDPEEYDASLKKWNLNTLPIVPENIKLKVYEKTLSQFNVIKELIRSKEVTELICATDAGREGELIFRYIYEMCGCKKPFKRLWISSMTDSAIKKGLANLKDGALYDNLYKSAKCRSEADWLVGINATRAFTVKYGALLSIGRVQTPTLSLLVNKKREIERFVPVKYFEVAAEFTKYSGTWCEVKTGETKIEDEAKAKEIAAKVKGKTGEIISIETEEKRIPHPFLFDLTELQRECNNKFGFSAQKTLDVAQSLYEKHKVITYPRTDSRFLTNDMRSGIAKVLESLKGTYGELLEYPLSLPELPITKRIVDDSKVSDHHAIIPTGKKAVNLSAEESKVFDLIARRLIATFYPPYVYTITKIMTLCENEGFLSKGQMVVDLGWKAVLGKDKDDAEVLPTLSEGETNAVTKVKANNKTTKPPAPYNEATLLSAMENAGRFVEDEALKEQLKQSGLGTPATRAGIIERLINVGYVTRQKKSLIATEKAEKLIDIVPVELKSPETTAKWERALSSITNGTMECEKFNTSIVKYVHYIVKDAKTSEKRAQFDAEQSKSYKGKFLGKCPKCDGGILENSKSFYCSNWRNGCKFSIWKNYFESSKVELTPAIVKKLLKSGQVSEVKAYSEPLKKFGVCTLKLDVSIQNNVGIMNFVADE